MHTANELLSVPVAAGTLAIAAGPGILTWQRFKRYLKNKTPIWDSLLKLTDDQFENVKIKVQNALCPPT